VTTTAFFLAIILGLNVAYELKRDIQNTAMFSYPPSPATLQWLSGGQFASRLSRSLRLWWLLDRLYGAESHWARELTQPFRYGALRDRLFAPSHPKAETLSVAALVADCRGTDCVCQRSLRHFLTHYSPSQSIPEWIHETAQRTGLKPTAIETYLDQAPFAVTHRSLRQDLALLVAQGWLEQISHRGYGCVPASQWLQSPMEKTPTSDWAGLSLVQTWQLLHILESVAFVQPNLEIVINALWEQVARSHPSTAKQSQPLSRRIFLHIDYVVSPDNQEHVDDFQQQVESLWQTPNGGVIQFDTWVAKEQRLAHVTVYPVCLHYARRAKYLSAYGIDPFGQVGWHNYRLDRIRSDTLQILPWGDPNVPAILKQQQQTGTLPTPEWIEQQLEDAWGLNFYLPKGLLILRFPALFAQDYVDNTVRHSTFRKRSYANLLQLVQRQITDRQEQQAVLETLQQRSPHDAYYQAWVRVGDINVIMRLRDWRPQGEVIAPWQLRQQMQREVEEERSHYVT
jgi:CRISPR-associated protein (TIGR03985 family)